MQLVASALAVTAWPAAAFGQHRALAGNCGDLTWGLLLIIGLFAIFRFYSASALLSIFLLVLSALYALLPLVTAQCTWWGPPDCPGRLLARICRGHAIAHPLRTRHGRAAAVRHYDCSTTGGWAIYGAQICCILSSSFLYDLYLKD